MSSPVANDPDTDLVKAARRGEEFAFTQLVRRHQAMVRGFLRRLCGSATYADDLAQETFVRAWRKINDFQGKAAFRTWLCRIAYTQFLQSRRAELRRLARDTAALGETDMLGDLRREAQARLDLDRALAGLAPDQRAVVALCFGEGMSHAEAAAALDMPLGTVKSHALRGRQKVLEFFDSGAGT